MTKFFRRQFLEARHNASTGRNGNKLKKDSISSCVFYIQDTQYGKKITIISDLIIFGSLEPPRKSDHRIIQFKSFLFFSKVNITLNCERRQTLSKLKRSSSLNSRTSSGIFSHHYSKCYKIIKINKKLKKNGIMKILLTSISGPPTHLTAGKLFCRRR